MHSCGNTAVKGWSWPNFWANLASFALESRQHREPRRAYSTWRIACVCAASWIGKKWCSPKRRYGLLISLMRLLATLRCWSLIREIITPGTPDGSRRNAAIGRCLELAVWVMTASKAHASRGPRTRPCNFLCLSASPLLFKRRICMRSCMGG